jgi:hypothetical protein
MIIFFEINYNFAALHMPIAQENTYSEVDYGISMLLFNIFLSSFALKGKVSRDGLQLRPLVYSLGLNNPPRICLTPRKWRVKNL